MKTRFTLWLSAFLASAAIAAVPAPEEHAPRVVPEHAPVTTDQFRAPAPERRSSIAIGTVATGLRWPWSIEELPDGALLVTERGGTMRIVTRGGGVSAPLAGIPAVEPDNRGGLLDVALAPDFVRSRRIFWAFSEPVGKESRLAIASGVLAKDTRAVNAVRVIWRMERASISHEHFGARLAFDRRGMLMFATGERSPDGGAFGHDAILAARNFAQDWSSTLGKVIRITPEGRPAPGNPRPRKPGDRADVYAAGFRNPLGVAIDPTTGDLWTVEHGPLSGDELNHIRPGRNYGWPVVSYGKEYHGEPIGAGISAGAGFEQPVYFWDPNVAPGGVLFYRGTTFPGWRGNIIVGGMKSQRLSRLTLAKGRVTSEEWLPIGARVRDVIEARDGTLLIATDEEKGRILRVTPR